MRRHCSFLACALTTAALVLLCAGAAGAASVTACADISSENFGLDTHFVLLGLDWFPQR